LAVSVDAFTKGRYACNIRSVDTSCADLGETDRAFEFLEKGYDQRDMFFAWIKPFSRFHLSVTDPRFVALLKKMGLEA